MKTSLKSNIRTSSLQKVGEGFIPNRFNWTKPSSWPDLRHITPDGTIGLLLCDKYPQIGFRVTCSTGNYKVFIDDKEYFIAQNKSQTNITIADITTPGILVNYPEPLTVHTLLIKPENPSDTIRSFQCRRATGTTTEQQGLLWAHFSMASIGLLEGFSNEGSHYTNPSLKAITCSGKNLEIKESYFTFNRADLEYVPVLKDIKTSHSGLFRNNANLKKTQLINSTTTVLWATFSDANSLEEAIFENIDSSGVKVFVDCFRNNYSLKKLPNFDYTSATDMAMFLTCASNILVPMLDLSAASNLTKIDCIGTILTPMYGFKGILVSKQAPFTGVASQINVSYTGLERTAIIALFNSMPTVTGGQKVNVTGTLGAKNLLAQDIAIAVNKGWEVLR